MFPPSKLSIDCRMSSDRYLASTKRLDNFSYLEGSPRLSNVVRLEGDSVPVTAGLETSEIFVAECVESGRCSRESSPTGTAMIDFAFLLVFADWFPVKTRLADFTAT